MTVGGSSPTRTSFTVPPVAGELWSMLSPTEAAALACAALLGKGDADAVSDAAGEAMRRALEASAVTGTVVMSPRPQAHLPNGAVIAWIGGGVA